MLESYIAGQTVKNVFVPAAVATGVGAAAFVGYKAAKAAFNWGDDMIDGFNEFLEDQGVEGGIWEPIVGKKTYTDKDGKTYTNPFAGVPLLGSLFGSGINLGIAFSPFD